MKDFINKENKLYKANLNLISEKISKMIKLNKNSIMIRIESKTHTTERLFSFKN